MANKKAKLARDEAPVMERLQSSIDKCIAGVATNNVAGKEKYVAREEKFDTWWAMMFKKQEMKIGLLKTNVVAIKRKEDLALLTADTSSMCDDSKACHKAQCDLILAEMRPPPASSNPMPAADQPEGTNSEAPAGEEEEEVEEVFAI
jgi:hypothetical protein